LDRRRPRHFLLLPSSSSSSSSSSSRRRKTSLPSVVVVVVVAPRGSPFLIARARTAVPTPRGWCSRRRQNHRRSRFFRFYKDAFKNEHLFLLFIVGHFLFVFCSTLFRFFRGRPNSQMSNQSKRLVIFEHYVIFFCKVWT
jgi:hypothetical protein